MAQLSRSLRLPRSLAFAFSLLSKVCSSLVSHQTSIVFPITIHSYSVVIVHLPVIKEFLSQFGELVHSVQVGVVG